VDDAAGRPVRLCAGPPLGYSAAMSQIVYKIAPRALWAQAIAKGVFEGAPIDLADGFIHFSTAEQARETAAKHFAGQGDLVLIAVDDAQFGSAMRYEVSRGGALFPHLYATLPVSAVLWVRDLPLGEDGLHVFPDMGA
jgi:uncharacterized protein (DUF952 family)